MPRPSHRPAFWKPSANTGYRPGPKLASRSMGALLGVLEEPDKRGHWLDRARWASITFTGQPGKCWRLGGDRLRHFLDRPMSGRRLRRWSSTKCKTSLRGGWARELHSYGRSKRTAGQPRVPTDGVAKRVGPGLGLIAARAKGGPPIPFADGIQNHFPIESKASGRQLANEDEFTGTGFPESLLPEVITSIRLYFPFDGRSRPGFSQAMRFRILNARTP